MRVFSLGSALGTRLTFLSILFGGTGGVSLHESTFAVGSKYFGVFCTIVLDAGFQASVDSLFRVPVAFAVGSKARIVFCSLGAPPGCHAGSRLTLVGDGGAFEPMNFGRLIVPPGRQTGGALPDVTEECRSGLGALSRRTCTGTGAGETANRLGGVSGCSSSY